VLPMQLLLGPLSSCAGATKVSIASPITYTPTLVAVPLGKHALALSSSTFRRH
jgi:hypothetical protein